ncbi:MAG: hypothetical protein KAY44_04285, partial [Neisseria sp.]|nr:hypothetical protein [Neisseria sp.]
GWCKQTRICPLFGWQFFIPNLKNNLPVPFAARRLLILIFRLGIILSMLKIMFGRQIMFGRRRQMVAPAGDCINILPLP